MSSLTTHYSLIKPAVNSAVDADLWGGELNDDLDSLDSLIWTATNWITRAVTTTGSVTTADRNKLLTCDATGGAVTLTLPAVSGNDGLVIAFKRTNSGANAVILDGNASETIDGATTLTLSTQYDAVILQCNGATWSVMAQKIYLAPAAAPDYVYLETQTASASTALNFTAFDNSTYEYYIFEFNNLLCNGACVVAVRFSTDGGSTYQTATSAYSWNYSELPNGTASPTQTNGGDSSGATRAQIALTGTVGNGNRIFGKVELYGAGNTSNNDTFASSRLVENSKVHNGYGCKLSTGFIAGAVNALRFSNSGGTSWTSGTIKMYGVTKT